MKIDRRKFLTSLSAIGLSGIVGSSEKVFASENFSGYPDRFGMLTDFTLCIGCRFCEKACKEAHNLPPIKEPLEDKSIFEKIRRPDDKFLTVVNRYTNTDNKEIPVYRKVQCNHCDEPACVSACLVGALKKTPEGPVIYNEKVCIGCRYCMIACPFYIPAYEYNDPLSPAIMKCDFCYNIRIKKGGIPACAEICPVEAITFGKRNQLIKLARDRIKRHPEKYIDYIYGEHEVGGTSWLYISGVPFEQLGFDTSLGTMPYPELTRGFLSAVPLVLVIWPAFLTGVYHFMKNRKQNTEVNTKKSEQKES
jgi:Fe-S-cluster-containing dehydrogenase component